MNMRWKTMRIVLAGALVGLGVWWWAQERDASMLLEQQQTSLTAGIGQFQQKDYEAALQTLRSVPSGHPMGWRARYFEGSSQIMLKDYEAAIGLLEEALLLNPSHTRIMHALGVAHFKMGNLAMSKAYFAQVLEIDPTDEEARGLMDIMANLERMQQDAPAVELPDEG